MSVSSMYVHKLLSVRIFLFVLFEMCQRFMLNVNTLTHIQNEMDSFY